MASWAIMAPAHAPRPAGQTAAAAGDPAPKVPAADAALRVLSYLAAQRGPVAAARVASDLDLPRSTTYDLLATLSARGFALHLPAERQYALGPAAHELSAGYLRHAPLARVGRRAVERMVDAVGESGHLSVLHGSDVLYVVEERARMRPSLVTDIGVRIPAHLTASGRSMLAAFPPAQLRALYPSSAELPRRHPEAGPRTSAELRRLLAEVRRDGIAREDGAVTPSFRSVAAAIRDAADWPIAAVALTWEAGTLSGEQEARCEAAVRSHAQAVATALGGRAG